jgi:hypothetical protein
MNVYTEVHDYSIDHINPINPITISSAAAVAAAVSISHHDATSPTTTADANGVLSSNVIVVSLLDSDGRP